MLCACAGASSLFVKCTMVLGRGSCLNTGRRVCASSDSQAGPPEFVKSRSQGASRV